jgi:hypothetical protein
MAYYVLLIIRLKPVFFRIAFHDLKVVAMTTISEESSWASVPDHGAKAHSALWVLLPTT